MVRIDLLKYILKSNLLYPYDVLERLQNTKHHNVMLNATQMTYQIT